MSEPRFLQIHTLHSYSAALLNRDDSGLAKRLPYGPAIRTRISSQCLKRHWRISDGTYALHEIEGAEGAVRSRELVTRRLRGPLEGEIDTAILDAIEPPFQIAVYGKDAAKGKTSRQPLLFGEPELRFLAGKFAEIARAATDAKSAKKTAETFTADATFKKTMEALRGSAALPAGLVSALFGRMVTSDPQANIDAPVHVAHAFTTHAEQSESDYFSVVDDLAVDDTGADHIGETEITSGLFYGYVVVDVPALVANLGGDRVLASEVVSRLVGLIATVSPGAKLGSTAPYGYATTLLVESGDRQPRSLAEAFRKPVAPTVEAAEQALSDKLETFDAAYQTGEARRFLSLRNESAFAESARLSLPELLDWVKTTVREAS